MIVTGQNDDIKIAAFALHMMKITRFWCNGWFSEALNKRSRLDRDRILEDLFDRFRRLLITKCVHCTYYSVVNMRIAKVV